MRKDAIICWYCEKMAMVPAPELGHNWYRCSKCGSTACINPTVPGQSPLTTEVWRDEEEERHISPRHVRRPKVSARSD